MLFHGRDNGLGSRHLEALDLLLRAAGGRDLGAHHIAQVGLCAGAGLLGHDRKRAARLAANSAGMQSGSPLQPMLVSRWIFSKPAPT